MVGFFGVSRFGGKIFFDGNSPVVDQCFIRQYLKAYEMRTVTASYNAINYMFILTSEVYNKTSHFPRKKTKLMLIN